jgi:UPF0716 family protein affecting phage T7 exclusion
LNKEYFVMQILATTVLGLAASAFLGFELFRQVGGPTHHRQAAHQRRGAAHGGELRQAAGVAAAKAAKEELTVATVGSE